MPDLGTQLRDYMDHIVERADTGALPIRLEHNEKLPPGRTPRPGWVIAIAAAIIVLLLIGGSNALFNALRSTPPADDDLPTTTAEVPDEQDATTTTTQVVAAPTTVDQVTVDVSASVVEGLGTLRWERVAGDETTVPQGVEADSAGGYVFHEGTKVWRSDDAVSWTSAEVAPQFADYRWVWFKDGWAIGSDEDEGHLYEAVGDDWVAVDLPDPQFPETSGVHWQNWVAIPIASGEGRLIDGTISGLVSWGEEYGMFEVECGEPEPCEMEPWAEWDPPSETFRILEPNRGASLAVLSFEVAGETVSFIDTVTGDVVHTVTGTPELPAARLLEGMQRGEGLVLGGGWVSVADGPWQWTDFPWQSHARPLAVQDGFVAYEFVYDWLNQPEAPLVSATTWKSADGIEWTDHGEPSFAGSTAEHMWVAATGEGVRATVVTGYDQSTGMELADVWESTDGLVWEAVDSPFPSWSEEFETDFGHVVTAMPQSTHLFWVSTDGSNWHEVLGPPGSHEPAGAGFAAAGAAGDILWTAVGENTGSRSLWIGRFEPEE